MSSLNFLVETLGWIFVVTGVGLSWIGLPGPLLTVLGLVAWITLLTSPWLGVTQVILLSLILILAEAAEQAGGFLGMKWSGIESRGWKGAVVGAICGLGIAVVLLNPIFIVVGILVGAWAGEVHGGRDPLPALKVAVGFGLGKLGGYVIKNSLTTGALGYLLVLRTWSLFTG